MKTKLLTLVCSILFLAISSRSHAQLLAGNYNTTPVLDTATDVSVFKQSKSSNSDLGEIPEALDPFNFIEAGNPKTLEEMGTLETQDPATAIVFYQTMLALGAGFGFNDDQTLWCLNAAYFLQLAMFSQSALYASLGFVYSGISADLYNRNFLDIQFKMLMFNAITRYNQVFFMYGAMLAYGLGADKFDSGGQKTDITRLTAALVLGLNIYLTTRLALMIQTNVFAYQSQTTKPESGGEFKDNLTWGAINKNNAVLISLVFLLNRAK